MDVLTDVSIGRAAALSTATLHESAGRAGALPSFIKPLDPTMHMAGKALPVRCPTGDNLWIHRALAVAQPGEILVIDAGPDREFGYWGEVMATNAIARLLKGVVLTGGVRDSQRLIGLGLPTFSSSICIRGTAKDPLGKGSVGAPIQIGAVAIAAGDLIVGDADGLIALAPAIALAAIAAGERRDAEEKQILKRIRAGVSTLEIYNLPGVA